MAKMSSQINSVISFASYNRLIQHGFPLRVLQPLIMTFRFLYVVISLVHLPEKVQLISDIT